MRAVNGILRKRLVLVLFVLGTVFLALIGRLAYIQLIQSPWLTKKAEDLWRRDIPVESKRGTILDRNGEVLAYNGSAPTVVAIPAQIKDKPATAEKLAKVLGVQTEDILSKISKRTSIVYVTPGGRKIEEQKAKEVRALKLPGIYVTEEGKRYYPFESLAAHILGFSGIDNQGLTGLEQWYDERLRGKKGSISFMANVTGQRISGEDDTYTPPENGQNLKLTIDKEISTFLRREIENVVATTNPDGVMGIVADPKTGEILAMENYPTFKPGNYKDYPQEVFNRNLAIWKTFEPGSTFKIVTLAAALEENKINLKDRFYDPGYYEVAGRKIRCWKAGGHGSETFLEVVENSCNPGFMLMGQRLGKEKLFSYIYKFGFGQKTGIDMPGEGKGIMFKLNRVGPLELATTSFGQGVSVTPIQQVMAVSAIANGGLLMEPHVAKEWIEPETGKVIERIEPKEKQRVVSEVTAKTVRETLESVVARGTGKNAFREGYRIAGKTGTAQVAAPGGGYKQGHYIVSFIGMAPADDPKLVAYIAVDNPKAGLVFGGVIAAPVVGNVLADSLHYLNVPARKNGISREYKYGDIRPVEVPQLAGLSIEEAQKVMIQSAAHLRVETVGQGKYVVAQAPAAGTKVPPGSAIRIFLSEQPAP
ncbi:stage V sporulation protein D [Effusibacillus consociatus]|uniref:Stage V sporulation protein D n=1 Tax=Effusibacillus consociatus TaxID=1117041 RepID=A0ABV9Q8Q7_9BACL